LNFLRLLPVIISFLLMAAHFFREGRMLTAFVVLLLPLLLLVRKAWVPRALQVTLLFGAVEWLRTLYFIAQMRIEFGMPWMRMAIILGAVALFTALSCLVFSNKTVRKRFSEVKE